MKRPSFNHSASPRPSKQRQQSDATSSFNSQASSSSMGGIAYSQESATPTKSKGSYRTFDYFENASSDSESNEGADDGNNYKLTSSPPLYAMSEYHAAGSNTFEGPSSGVPPMLERFVQLRSEEQVETATKEQRRDSPIEQNSTAEHLTHTDQNMMDEGENNIGTPATHEDMTLEDFASQPYEHRQELYAHIYQNQTIDLKDLQPPEECSFHPSLANEILQAYLQHITIIVKIWTNYDSVKKQFTVHPGVFSSSGKIHLTPKQQARLLALDKKTNFELHKIRFDVGTAFRSLYSCTFTITSANEGDMKASGKPWPEDNNAPHDTLRAACKTRFTQLRHRRDWQGQKGFRLADLEAVARHFQFRPQEFYEYHNWQEWFTAR